MDREELDERAAIRQYAGGLAVDEAENAALIDLAGRRDAAMQALAAQKPATGTIEQLRDEMELVCRAMQAAEGQEKDKLLAEWFELANRIIDVRKGVQK